MCNMAQCSPIMTTWFFAQIHIESVKSTSVEKESTVVLTKIIATVQVLHEGKVSDIFVNLKYRQTSNISNS